MTVPDLDGYELVGTAPARHGLTALYYRKASPKPKRQSKPMNYPDQPLPWEALSLDPEKVRAALEQMTPGQRSALPPDNDGTPAA